MTPEVHGYHCPSGCDRVPYSSCSILKDKTIKLWKITERDKRPEGYNLKDEEGKLKDLSTVTSLQVSFMNRTFGIYVLLSHEMFRTLGARARAILL